MRHDILAALERVLSNGDFILGEEVDIFERRFAQLCGVKYAVGVASGTDALILALKSLGIGPGDEVITAPNSFVASAASIVSAGACPVFVDVRHDMNMDPNLVEAAITSRTRAILPVHLTGKCADMGPLLEIAEHRGLYVVEDAAQAAGAQHKGRKAGSFGILGCFSFHPLKNLNAIGDGGIITTNDDSLAERLRLLRNHGLHHRDEVVMWGVNSRLDSIQAAVLNCRLDKLKEITEKKRRFAEMYRTALCHLVECPSESADEYAVYHLYVIQCDHRDKLKDFLENRGIDSRVHYPIPIHLQECSSGLGYKQGDFPVCERQSKRILSLPVHHCLADAQVDYVCESIADFYQGR
jgi:dTDP-4-amino-4,6-dideoxygalactose transaminase